MASPASPIEAVASVVLDTSAAININATGYCSQLLGALPIKCLVSDALLAELREGKRRGRHNLDDFEMLIENGRIGVAALDSQAEASFETLVIGPASETLGDGEAATIALALSLGAIPVIDERKATGLCARKFPTLKLGCTLDLLAHPVTAESLGAPRLKEAVLNALHRARMRVPPHYEDWTVGLIGMKAAASCRSLSRRARGA